jgi:hypothetical protein
VQLDRIDAVITAMRHERDTIHAGIGPALELGLRLAPLNSKAFDCATNVFLTVPTAQAAELFVKTFPSVIAGKTGRHTYTEWDQVLMGAGAAHPLMNPYNMPANAQCRKTYSRDMCAKSLDILERTILVPTHPLHTKQAIDDIVHNINAATRVALGLARKDDVEVRNAAPVDVIKYDTKQLAW